MSTDSEAVERMAARYARALALVPGKGERPLELFDALVDSACDVPTLIGMVRSQAAGTAESERNGHVPSVASTRSLVVEMTETITRDEDAARENGAQFDRMIEQFRAEALRNFVDSAADLLDCSGDTRWKTRALDMADRIEGEA